MANMPNILLITTDQQRYDSCGPRAPSFLRTPHFDHLAREGVSFAKAYTESAICVASRVCILTGQSVFTHGNPGNGPTSLFVKDRETLPSHLNNNGYQTIAIGKMHFGPQRTRHGFQEMILPEDYYRWIRRTGYPQQPMRHGLGQNELYPTMSTVPESLTLTSWTAEQGVEYIRERRDPGKPFFMWLSFSKPHPPLDPPEPYYSMYRNCDIPKPAFGDWSIEENRPYAIKNQQQTHSFDLIPPEVIREARSAYYGLITQNDYNMGRVFAALQDKNLFDETMIVYTSDHGEFLGDHHMGSKVLFHESSAHVPFVLRLPKSMGKDFNNTTCETPVYLADIMPTILSVAGVEIPPSCDGNNLLKFVNKEKQERFIYATFGKDNPSYIGVTDGTWKYIWYTEGSQEQLFDLINDPQELKNLANDSKNVKMKSFLKNKIIEHLKGNEVYVKDGKLTSKPIPNETENQRRNKSWPGYHTEYFDKDVRH